jgi:signal transduction histidine kinase
MALLIVIASAFFISLNIGNWLFLRSMEKYLDEELGRRLVSVVNLIAHSLDGNRLETIVPGEENKPEVILMQQQLYDMKSANGLENLYVIDLTHRVLSDAKNYQIGAERIYLSEDSVEIAQAREHAVSSSLHQVVRNPFKSAYAPVRNDFGQTVGIVVVEANANFFELIHQFQRTLIFTMILSFVLVSIVSIVLFFMLIRLFRLQDTIQKQERLAQMGQMAAGIAHEIRNPLGIIGGTAEVLRQKYSASTRDELFTYIPDEVKRLSRLVNDFLTFAREKELQLKSVRLNQLLLDLVGGVKKEIGNKNISFQLNLQENLPNLQADEDALKQIFLNILSNGVQAIDSNGYLEVRTQLNRKDVDIFIRDTGPGIDPEHLAKIFEPFFTTKASGSGLGLAITKQLVEKHRGTITVKTQKGIGTEFHIVLPLAKRS